MIELNPKTYRTVIDDTVESMHLIFRPGTKVRELVRAEDPLGQRVLIYAADDGLPVAIQFVDPVDLEALEASKPAGWKLANQMTKEQATVCLFAFCTMYLRCMSESRKQLGTELIREALECTKALNDDNCLSTRVA